MPNETKHTPGPWHVGGKDGSIIYAEDGFAIANATVFHLMHGFFPQSAANAQLIARAPTLLAENESLRQQNAELVRVLQWWQAQMGDDACDDMGKLLDTMTGKVSAILATVQS